MHNFFNCRLNRCEGLIDKFCRTGDQTFLQQARSDFDKCTPAEQEHMMQHTLKSLPKLDHDMNHWMNAKYTTHKHLNWFTCKTTEKTSLEMLKTDVQKFEWTVAAINCFKPGNTYPIDYNTYNNATKVLQQQPMPNPTPAPGPIVSVPSVPAPQTPRI